MRSLPGELKATPPPDDVDADGLSSVPVPSATPGRRANVVNLASVAPQPVGWLWRPYIPAGKLTILEGDPGVGKSFLAIQIAACLTRGWPLPCEDGKPLGEHVEASNVVYLSAEDGIADTLAPRFTKAEADLERVQILTGIVDTGEDGESQEVAFSLKHDLAQLREAMDKYRPAIVVVDPIQAYLGAGVDMHKANEVRPVLAPLAGLAEESGCAVVLIRHLAKALQSHAVYQGLGSIDFAAAARSMLRVGKLPTDPGKRVLVHEKCSVAQEGPSLGFALERGEFVWTGVVDVTAEDLMRPVPRQTAGRRLKGAEVFLTDLFADGRVLPSNEVERLAKRAGIGESTLQRAKRNLGIVSERTGVPGKRGKGQWFWRLPTDAAGDLDSEEGNAVPDEDELTLPTDELGDLNRASASSLRQSTSPTTDTCDLVQPYPEQHYELGIMCASEVSGAAEPLLAGGEPPSAAVPSGEGFGLADEDSRIAELRQRYDQGEFGHKARARLTYLFAQDPAEAKASLLKACDYFHIDGATGPQDVPATQLETPGASIGVTERTSTDADEAR